MMIRGEGLTLVKMIWKVIVPSVEEWVADLVEKKVSFGEKVDES